VTPKILEILAMTPLANNLKSLRMKRGIDQIHLAKVLGTTQGSISAWENSTRTPRFPMLKKISVYYNVSMDDLYNEKKQIVQPEVDLKKALDIASTYEGRPLTAAQKDMVEELLEATLKDRKKNNDGR
jgi:transcriptional regulator with XRE-family HTH domain